MKYLLLILLSIIDKILIVYERERGLLMRKFSKILLMSLFLITTFANFVYASETEYIVTKEMVYESTRKNNPLPSGFVEVLVGNVDFVQYQEDNEIVMGVVNGIWWQDEFLIEVRYGKDKYGWRYAQRLKDGIFSTKAEAEKKLKELQNER